jgi:glycerol-3-phosphate dehydrogenase
MTTSEMRTVSTQDYDLIVVGGGVLGVMIALEATRRNLKPLLLERGRLGAATSANSLRIVHGGLRYLQSLDLARHRESVAERAWFLETFPDLVRPLACLMPLYGEGARRPSAFRAAFFLDRLLVGAALRGARAGGGLPRSRILSPSETRETFPGVMATGLRGAALWHDAIIQDPARLLAKALDWARAAGASALEGVAAVSLLAEGGKASGVLARAAGGKEDIVFRAPSVINAAGPWAKDLARSFGTSPDRLPGMILAWNLVVDRPPVASCALALKARAAGAQTFFLVPWGGRMLAGTGYAPWIGGPDSPMPDERQTQAFLDALNAAAPGLDLRRDQVSRIMAGLLPVSRTDGSQPADRDTILDHAALGGPKGLLSVVGVKLTTARALADRTLRHAFPTLAPRPYDAFPRPGPPA